MKSHGIVTVLHILAAVAVIGGVARTAGIEDALVKSSILSQYILWAILFELGALNAKD